MTESQYQAFIRSALRRASVRWKPIGETLREARVAKGLYICASCQNIVPVTTVDENGKRVKNVSVDHVNPVIDPEVGLVNWDRYIYSLFCEKDNLQVLCRDCHDYKTHKEREVSSARKAREKEMKKGMNPYEGEDE